MAEWTTIPDDVLEPGDPIRSIDIIALRDNPVAIAGGASGAPRVTDAALSTAVTSAGTDWVLARTAGADVGAVGTYAFAATSNNTSTISAGSTIAGSNLLYAGVSWSSGFGASIASSGSLSGTWRAMGFKGARVQDVANARESTLWLRIS